MPLNTDPQYRLSGSKAAQRTELVRQLRARGYSVVVITREEVHASGVILTTTPYDYVFVDESAEHWELPIL